MSNKRTEDPTIVTWLSDERYVTERKAKQAEKPEGRGLALELIKQAQRSRITAPQRIPKRGPEGDGHRMTENRIAREVQAYVDQMNINHGFDHEGIIETTRAIKTALATPRELAPVQALAHVQLITKVGNSPIPTPPTTRTRGQPKKPRDRLSELVKAHGPGLKAQVERGLKETPKREAARQTRRAAGEALRETIRYEAERLRDEGTPRAAWVRQIQPLVPCDARHIRRILRGLGYSLSKASASKRINKLMRPKKRKHRKAKGKRRGRE